MYESVQHQIFFSASPKEIYEAWLSSEKHTAMTGGEARCSDKVGGSFTAWDGYISGKNMELLENRRILQSWRTSEFLVTDEDSILEILLEPTTKGTKFKLNHTKIPQGQNQYYQGWIENYFVPMKDYFR